MKKFGKKYASIAFSILGGIVFVVGVNTAIYAVYNDKNINKRRELDLLNDSFDVDKDKDMIKFYKDNTISLSFIKNTYEKTNGTAWIKNIDLVNNEFTFCTNLHVVADYIKINSDGTMSLKDDTRAVNIKYFDSDDSQKLYLQRTDIKNWKLSKYFANLERTIPWQYSGFKNVENKNGKSVITNGYIDYVELKYTLNVNDTTEFAKWLRTRKYVPQIATEQEINDFLDIAYTTPRDDNYMYIAGFPSTNQEPKWVEQKFRIAREGSTDNTYFTSSLHEISTIPWFEKSDGIRLTNSTGKTIEQRSISHQLIFNGLVMGNGSSGSMICSRINGQIKIFAIWWGTYGKRMGAGDLLSTSKYNAYAPNDNGDPNVDSEIHWEDWEGYDITR